MSATHLTTENSVQETEQENAIQVQNELVKKNNEELLRLRNDEIKITNETLQENRTIRKKLMICLSIVSLLWLIFTGYVIMLLGCRCFMLSDVVATAFITTSLATVCGLWAIGLRYFFK